METNETQDLLEEPPGEPVQHPTPPHSTDVDSPAPTRSSAAVWLAGAALLVGLAVVVLQIVTLRTAGDARDLAESAAAESAAIAADVGTLRAGVEDIDAAVGGLEQQIETAALSESLAEGPSSAAEVAGPLPPYPQSGADPAVESAMRVAPVTGPEYYSGEEVTIAANGETATVWLVWAHWCPHCQTELPELSDFWADSSADYPNVEIVTISTAIDPTRGNPLEPYLESQGFPFPVLVDDTGNLASILGTSAFPFWVVTGPDGEVLFRRPGALGIEQITGLVGSVEEFVSAS